MDYSDFISLNLKTNTNIDYAEYIAENLNNSIEYAEYIAEHLYGKSKEELKREERLKKLNQIFN